MAPPIKNNAPQRKNDHINNLKKENFHRSENKTNKKINLQKRRGTAFMGGIGIEKKKGAKRVAPRQVNFN